MTAKQLKFLSEYTKDFNATQAAVRAGYSPKTAYSIGQRLLKNAEIQEAMQKVEDGLIADRVERLAFWTATMRDNAEDMKHRLRASELLGKSKGDFLDRAEIKNEVTNEHGNYDLSKLSKEELLQLRELVVKAQPEERKEENNTWIISF